MDTRMTTGARTTRLNGLRAMLESRRQELASEVYGRIRGAREDGVLDHAEVLDPGESWEAEIQQAIGYQLLEMKSETLSRIEAALGRIDDGTYGDCVECDREISESRLRALPFAARCRPCEERREAAARPAAAPLWQDAG